MPLTYLKRDMSRDTRDEDYAPAAVEAEHLLAGGLCGVEGTFEIYVHNLSQERLELLYQTLGPDSGRGDHRLYYARQRRRRSRATLQERRQPDGQPRAHH